MTLQGIANAFWRWLTEPVSPLPLALFRILFGVILLLNGIFLFDDLKTWFGTGGIFPLELSQTLTGRNRLNLFLLLNNDSETLVYIVYGVYMAASACLAAGLFSRRMSFLVYIALASFSHRNVYILHSGDTFIRLASFLMIFAPSGAALSVESLVRGHPEPRISPVAFRMLQFQVCLLYAAAAIFKLKGNAWLNGSAVYIVQQLTEFQRFPVPGFMRTEFASRVQTWGTLIVEAGFPLLVWLRDTRRYIIAGVILVHLGIEYSMNIQLFEWTLIAAMALFLNDDEIRRLLWPSQTVR